MKAIDFAVSRILPEDMRQDGYDLSKKGMGNIMAQVASKYPDRFGEIAKRLGDLGRNAAWYQGYTTSGSDTRPIIDTSRYYAQMDAELDDLRKQKLDKAEFGEQRTEIYMKYSDMIEKDTMKAALGSGNNFARAVASGARGNAAHVKAILSTPGVYSDSKGRIIPMFVRNSFSGGLRPAEVLAGTYGARAAVVSTKTATAKGGDFCLEENTLIRMADFSVKRIIDVNPGDLVLGSDKLGQTFPTSVVRKFDQGVKHVVDYVFRRNSSRTTFTETCTKEHKFAAQYYPSDISDIRPTEVKPIQDLLSQRWKFLHTNAFDDTGKKATPYALLLGLLTGDGTLPSATAKSRVLFTCHDDSLITDTNAYLAALDLRWVQRKTQPNQYRVSRVGPPTGHKGLRSVLLKLVGSGRAYNKTIPSIISESDNASVKDFLKGYFATDGCVTTGSDGRHYYSFSSASQLLLKQLKKLCGWRLGVYGGSVVKTKVGGPCVIVGVACNRRPLYTWAVNRADEIKLLDNILKSTPGVKGHKVIAYVRKSWPAQQKVTKSFRLISKSNERVAQCYDIEVDHKDHLFVLASGLVCSNSKLVAQGTSNYNVTEKDCGVGNGLDLFSDDESLAGRVLAMAAGDLPAGTVVDRQALARIRKIGKPVVVRSAMTCNAAHGLCSKCVGVQADGYFPKIGDSIGITAGHALTEPIVQGSLNLKHNSGMAKGKKSFSGFSYISQFVQIPDEFKDKAAVAERAGMVEKIEDAPQGGKFVTVGGEQHFALPGFESMVKVGDNVEAGDQLSEGLVNPADIVRLRGLGEGRRYYAERLGQILTDSGNPPDKRNVEILARSAVDNYITEDPDEDSPWSPDESVRSADFIRGYTPPKDTADTHISKAVGTYLQKPVLHYSIGTKLTPKMTDRLQSVGIENVSTSRTEPWFKPEMKRLRTAAHDSKDWLVSMGTSYLTTQMRDALERGDETNVQENYHFGPRLAYGAAAGKGAFGENVATTGKF